MKLLAVSGSLRAASGNTLLLRAACELAPPGVSVELFDGLGALPHFNPDLEDSPQPDVTRWKQAVTDADGLIVSTPEYAHGIPGTLKNALDWLVGGMAIVDKPILLLNASPLSLYAPAALTEVLRAMSAEVLAGATINVHLRGQRPAAFDPLAEPALADPIRTGLHHLVAAIRARRAAGRR
jgi:NAD(P)H-dependent FMN reductase